MSESFIDGHFNELNTLVRDFRDGAFWVMHWEPREMYPDKPAQEQMLKEEDALGILLIEDVIFVTSHWFKEDWPEEARKSIALIVNCNDVFAWACADGEHLPHSEIGNLYRRHLADPVWGSTIWCCLRRNERPQLPVEKKMREAGVWNEEMDGLPPKDTG